MRLRIGLTGDMGNAEATEIVRINADRVVWHGDSFLGGSVIRAGGGIGTIIASEIGMESGEAGAPHFAYISNSGPDDIVEVTTQNFSGSGNGNIFATVVSQFTNIQRVDSTGNLWGKFFADNGRINRLLADNNIGGSLGNDFAQIRAARGGLEMRAGRYDASGTGLEGGDITVSAQYDYPPSEAPAQASNEGKLRMARAVRYQGGGGSMAGSLEIKGLSDDASTSFENWLRVDHDLSATLTVKSLDAHRLVWVGNDFTGTATYGEFANTSTLVGQMVVNGGAGGGSWTGTAQTGWVTLSPDVDYTQLSSSVGNGAVGEAPFRIHNEDCDPPYVDANGDTVLDPAEVCVSDLVNGCPIRVRYYGPIFKNTGSTSDWLRYVGGSGPTNQSATYTLPSDPFGRDVLIDGFALLAGRVYTFNPGRSGVTNPLRCRFVNGTPAVVDEPYVFVGRSCSPADVGAAGGVTGSDGVLDNNDYISFISLYFAQDPVADMGVGAGLPGHDGLWNNNDFIAFINYFFNDAESCTGGCSTEPRCQGFAPIMGGNRAGGESDAVDQEQDRAAFLRDMASMMPDGPEKELLLQIAAELDASPELP